MKSGPCILCFRPLQLAAVSLSSVGRRILPNATQWSERLPLDGFVLRVATTWRCNLIQSPLAQRSLITFHPRWALNKRRCVAFNCSSASFFLLPFCLIASRWSRDQSMHLAILIFLHLRVGNSIWFCGALSAQVDGTPHPHAASRRSLLFHLSLNVTRPECNMKNMALLILPAREICFFCCAGTSIGSISTLLSSSCFIEMVDKEDLIFFFLSSRCLVCIRRQRNSNTKEHTNWQTECRECVQLWLERPFYCATHKVTAYDIPHKQQKWGY